MTSNLKHLSRLSLRIMLAAVGASFLLMPVFAEPQSDLSGELKTGREIYLKACASCHGADGKGQPQSRVGFDTPIPDFTNCDFASREPRADWVAIAHQGGPVRGFSRLMPAFGGVLKVEELELTVRYINTLCTNKNWPRGELNFPRALYTGKAFPEDELVVSVAADENWNEITNKIVYEQRFGARNQWEIVFPFGWNKMQDPNEPGSGTDWGSNLGDIALAVKRALYHSGERGSIFSGTAELILPTGDETRGFGKGTFVLEPFLTYGQILPSDFFFQSQLGLELPFQSDKVEKEAFLRMALGRTFTSGPWGRSWSPMIELLTARELAGGAKIHWDVVPEIQITLNRRQHIMFNFGVRIPINDREGRPVQFMAYILWDWFDGGFFEGWREQ